jgi:hypothetical protein
MSGMRLKCSLLAVYFLGSLAALAQTSSINLSHDLVRLGIASQNLPPNSPSVDARPLFQAALDYVKNHGIQLITLDRGAYYFLTAQNANSYLHFLAFSDLTVDLA